MIVQTSVNIIKSSVLANHLILNSVARRSISFRKVIRSLRMPDVIEPPYSHVTQIGDPVLRKKSEPVPAEHVKSEEVDLFINQMIDVLRSYDLVGIAAPQIGIGLRIIAMEFSAQKEDRFSAAVYKARQMSTLPLTVVINPVLKVTNYNKVKFPEGCASVKGFSADVERYEGVNLTGLSRKGEPLSIDLQGWNARIAQHEMDHLDGRIYTDIMDPTTFNCTCWQAINAHGGRVELRFTPK